MWLVLVSGVRRRRGKLPVQYSTVQYSTARVTLPLSRTSGGRQELAILSGALAGNPRRAPRCCCWVQLSARYLAPRTALLRNTPRPGS